MMLNEVFAGAIVLEGYTMLALVMDDDMFHAIIHREKVDDYVMCYGYDITDGTWCQGHYCCSYEQAIGELVKVLNY